VSPGLGWRERASLGTGKGWGEARGGAMWSLGPVKRCSVLKLCYTEPCMPRPCLKWSWIMAWRILLACQGSE
jgi:hypothetical protein